jgi:hypothetical protein
MTTVTTKLEIKSWDENPYRELPDGRKLSRAEVVLAGTGGELTGGAFESLLYYKADGTSTFVTTMQLDTESGSLFLTGQGGFDGSTARVEAAIVDGTGALAGASGTVESVSTHQDYPNMPITLTYDLP